MDKGRDVKFTLRVHRGVGLLAKLPHNGGSAKAYTRHDGGSRKRRMHENGLETGKLGYWRVSFKVIYTVYLGESSCNQSCLVLVDSSV